jgi:hypothetical protein
MALWLIRFLDRCDCYLHDRPRVFFTGLVCGTGFGFLFGMFLGVSVTTWLSWGMH